MDPIRVASESLNYAHYAWKRLSVPAQVLRDTFPLADKFERRYQEDMAGAGAANLTEAA